MCSCRFEDFIFLVETKPRHPATYSGAYLFLQSLYFEPVRFGAQVMNNVLWLRGKFLLFAYDMDMCKSPLLQKFRVSSSSYTWKFVKMTSLVYCRIFLQHVGSSTQTLADRERSRWGKNKQTKANKAVCGDLCLWWRHRMQNVHVPIPLLIMHVPAPRCLRTMEQTFINLLEPRLNAPWVRDLVKSKHTCQALKDPIRCVRRHVVSWREFRRYRRTQILRCLRPCE